MKNFFIIIIFTFILYSINISVYANEGKSVFATEQNSKEEAVLKEGKSINDKENELIFYDSETQMELRTFTDEDDAGNMNYFDLNECDELLPVDLDNEEFNVMTRNSPITEVNIANTPSEDMINAYGSGDNTDPNYAYVVNNEDIFQGTIQTEGEFRWYAFILNEKSKSTILVQMAQSLDADLYLFQLNGSQLELIGGSATAGGGAQELYTQRLEAGTYFFAVAGYSGIGNYAFAYYQSSLDANLELNDNKESATNVEMGSPIVGIIDHPGDIDYYKVTANDNMIFNYSISSTNGYKLSYAGSDNSTTPKVVNGNTVLLNNGTHYFAVVSPNALYSSESVYTISFNKIGNLAPLNLAPYAGINEEAGIVFQTDYKGVSNGYSSVYYINGNPIDINYQWKFSDSNSYGSQSYNISLRGGNDVIAHIKNDPERPSAVWYRNSTRPSYGVSGRPALAIKFISSSAFYSINCLCTGAYAQNNLVKDMNTVTVIVDPETGKMIDIYSFNYFYDFAVGSNSISVLTNYYENLKYYLL